MNFQIRNKLIQFMIVLFGAGAVSIIGLAPFKSFASLDSPDACSGRYDGTWSFGNGESMSLRVIRTTAQNVDVVVTTRAGYETTQGTCRLLADNSGRILFQGEKFDGDVRLFASGRASGVVNTFAFKGTKATSGPGPAPRPTPEPRPRPRPTPLPQPEPAPTDVCNGEIFGRWGFNGNERPLSLTFRRLGYDEVEVTFSSLGQVEFGRGFCQISPYNGTALIGFRTPFNEGRMDVDAYGSVRGGITGAPFSGSVRQ